MKTLNEILVKNTDAKTIVAKYPVKKHADLNGNDDAVFNAAKIKKANRTKNRQGYEPGADEKVYEETIDESFKKIPDHQVYQYAHSKGAMTLNAHLSPEERKKSPTLYHHVKHDVFYGKDDNGAFTSHTNRIDDVVEKQHPTLAAAKAYAHKIVAAKKIVSNPKHQEALRLLHEALSAIPVGGTVKAHGITFTNVRKHPKKEGTYVGEHAKTGQTCSFRASNTRLNEELINELSPDTLRRYREKALVSKEKSNTALRNAAKVPTTFANFHYSTQQGNEKYDPISHATRRKMEDKLSAGLHKFTKTHQRIADNRDLGMHRAKKQLVQKSPG